MNLYLFSPLETVTREPRRLINMALFAVYCTADIPLEVSFIPLAIGIIVLIPYKNPENKLLPRTNILEQQ
jgi:hypothetical protein